MTDPLTAAANAISTSSPRVRAFAQQAAARIIALEQAQPPAPPSGQVLWREDFADNTLAPELLRWSGTETVTSDLWGGTSALLRTVAGSAGSGAPNSQQASIYMGSATARTAAGSRTCYGVTLGLASTHMPVTGQWNWLVEWHTGKRIDPWVQASGAASNGIGLWSWFTDVNTGQAYDANTFVLVMRTEGGSTDAPFQSKPNPDVKGEYRVLCRLSELLGRQTRIVAEIFWTTGTDGFWRTYLNGTLRGEYHGPTLLRSPDGSVVDEPGHGVYNYHPAVSYQTDVYFKDWRIGTSVAAVS